MFRRILPFAALGAVLFLTGEARAEARPTDGSLRIDPQLSQRLVKTGETTRLYLRLGIKAERVQRRIDRAPLNVALVIDRSGSMQGARIEGARTAAMMAIDRLGPNDIVSVVSYDDKVEIEVPATRATNREAIKDRIRRLTPRGSTAIHAGLMGGLGEIRKFKSRDYVNRVILLSDGLANVGPSSPDHFARLGREFASDGITVSTIGLGLGYNEDLMAKLASNADGSHVFVQEPADLAQFLARELNDAHSIFAQDIDITIELKGRVVPLRSLGRNAEIKGSRVAYKVGQLMEGIEQVLIAELEVPADLASTADDVATIAVSYQALGSSERVTRTERVRLAASTSTSDVEASRSAEVMRDVTLLTAREAKSEAIKLRDAGRVEEARQKFQQNAADIAQQASKYGFRLDGTVAEEAQANTAAAAPATASPEAWNKQRKIMRGQDAYSPGASQRY